MIDVARCESGFRQYDKDHNVLLGVANSHDIGIFQVNLDHHLKSATDAGIDIYTPEGNVKYAKMLYAQQGLRPWFWSKPCWGKQN
jgi:hypothetical protein